MRSRVFGKAPRGRIRSPGPLRWGGARSMGGLTSLSARKWDRMTRLLRRMRLRSRLLLAFGVFCLLISVMTWVGTTQSSRQADIADEVGRLQVLTRDVMQLKFRDADVSGWQVAYA